MIFFFAFLTHRERKKKAVYVKCVECCRGSSEEEKKNANEIVEKD